MHESSQDSNLSVKAIYQVIIDLTDAEKLTKEAVIALLSFLCHADSVAESMFLVLNAQKRLPWWNSWDECRADLEAAKREDEGEFYDEFTPTVSFDSESFDSSPSMGAFGMSTAAGLKKELAKLIKFIPETRIDIGRDYSESSGWGGMRKRDLTLPPRPARTSFREFSEEVMGGGAIEGGVDKISASSTKDAELIASTLVNIINGKAIPALSAAHSVRIATSSDGMHCQIEIGFYEKAKRRIHLEILHALQFSDLKANWVLSSMERIAPMSCPISCNATFTALRYNR